MSYANFKKTISPQKSIYNQQLISNDITHFFSRIFVCILNTLVYRFQYRILKITQTSSLIITPIFPIKKIPT